jgi:polar amino acid transport system substrate-binding protein
LQRYKILKDYKILVFFKGIDLYSKKDFLMKNVMFFISLLLIFTNSLLAESLEVLTEEWAPFNYTENGTLTGISTEFVTAVLDETKLDYTIKVMPWKRAYVLVQQKSNTLLFTTSRTPQRENLFYWIGPLYPREISLYKLRSRTDIKINTIHDIKKFRLGVVRGGSTEEYLIENGFQDNVHYFGVTEEEQNLKKLMFDRIDLIPGSDFSMPFRLKKNGYSFSNVEKVYTLINQGGYYIAINKNTPKSIVDKIETAFVTLEKQGLREKILNRFYEKTLQ